MHFKYFLYYTNKIINSIQIINHLKWVLFYNLLNYLYYFFGPNIELIRLFSNNTILVNVIMSLLIPKVNNCEV